MSEDDLGKAIVIATIVIDSPAYSAGVMAKDMLVAVDGHKIESLKQAAKMIKNKSRYASEVHITACKYVTVYHDLTQRDFESLVSWLTKHLTIVFLF